MTFVISVLVASAAAEASETAIPDVTRVRTGNVAISRLIASGAARSPILMDLLSRFERTHWLAFVERGRCPAPTAVACLLHIVGRYGGEPYVRILVNEGKLRHPDQEISSIAHELQHALEAAEAVDVTDSVSLAALFRRIGHVSVKSQPVVTYETNAALRVGNHVLKQLQQANKTRHSRGRLMSAP